MKRRRIQLKRIDEAPSARDGLRVLVEDRWPRGLSRSAAATDLWLKEAAPSRALRRWYDADRRRWRGFCSRYREELARKPALLALLDELRRRMPVTLLFGASQDPERSSAAVLRAVLDSSGADR